VSSLKERGRSIPTTRIVSMLWAGPFVEAGSRQRADGVKGWRPAAERGRTTSGVKG
jgi:hypothetical protein